LDDPVKPIGSTKAQTLLEATQPASHSAIDYVVALEDGETRVLTEEEERELGDIAAAKSLMK
jgi:hypothetical protein